MKPYTNTKVVSRNFIMDFVAMFENLVGLNLKSYEKMIQKGMQQLELDLNKNNIKLEWYRYEITQLTNGAVAVLLYGDKK